MRHDVSASITRMTQTAPRGHDESAPTGNAAYPHSGTPRRQAAARCVRSADAGTKAPADDADARGLVGLARGGWLPAVPRPAVRADGTQADEEHAARVGPGVPRGRRGDHRRGVRR